MTGRQDYPERRNTRIERLKLGAAKTRAKAEATLRHVDDLANQRPLGQPILVGHHSEKSARRHQAQIESGMKRGVDLLEHAEELERRAAAADGNTAISTDDPDATERLQEKLVAVEARRDRWKAIAQALRSRDATALHALSLTAEERRGIALSNGDVAYAVKNAGAEVRRIKTRLAQLLHRASRAPLPEERVGAVVIDEAENRVRLRFSGKPLAPSIQELKRRGFRWSRTAGVWQRHASEEAWRVARAIAELARTPSQS